MCILMFSDLTPARYVLRTLQRIRSPDIEPALAALPFPVVKRLLARIIEWVQKVFFSY